MVAPRSAAQELGPPAARATPPPASGGGRSNDRAAFGGSNDRTASGLRVRAATEAAQEAPGRRRSLADLAGRRVVFLNWRDLEHPQAGGAEVFCQSVAERFAAAGARVDVLTAQPPGLSAQADARGVHLHRAGGTFGVYPAALTRLARMSWLTRPGEKVDGVVDCQNGIPFFSPLVLPRAVPVVQVLHHVHQKQFPLYFPGPAARLGQLLEAPGSRWVYRRRPVAVVSPSTRDEVRDVLALPGPRFLVPNGVDLPPTPPRAPSPRPTIVCVGRLVPHKRMHLLLDALPGLLAAHPGLVVHIVGDGPDRVRLANHAAALGLAQSDATDPAGGTSAASGTASGNSRHGGVDPAAAPVRWHGYVPAAVRDALVSAAWLTVNPSHGEGWGLSVLQANAHGVPAIAFRVPGLCDAVRDGHTGWLVDSTGDLGAAIGRALRLLADPVEAQAWRRRAWAWARCFSWDASAELLARVLLAETDRLNAHRKSWPGRAGRPGHGDARRADDVVTVAEFEWDVRPGVPRLRRTDLVYRVGPAHVKAVLYGASPLGARAALTRTGITSGVRLRPATGEDLLLAAGLAASPTAARAG